MTDPDAVVLTSFEDDPFSGKDSFRWSAVIASGRVLDLHGHDIQDVLARSLVIIQTGFCPASRLPRHEWAVAHLSGRFGCLGSLPRREGAFRSGAGKGVPPPSEAWAFETRDDALAFQLHFQVPSPTAIQD